MPPFHAIIFDFDLTLVDTRQGAVECFNYALTDVGLPPAEPEAIVRTIGIVLEESFPLLAGTKRMDLFSHFFALYRQRSNEDMDGMTTFYPSAPIVVRQLKESGFRMGILSSGRRQRIEATLRNVGLLECFQTIIGYEDVANHKPDPAGLREAVRRLGSFPKNTLYIGNSLVDAQTAQSGGTSFIAVLSGATPREAFVPFPTSLCWVTWQSCHPFWTNSTRSWEANRDRHLPAGRPAHPALHPPLQPPTRSSSSRCPWRWK